MSETVLNTTPPAEGMLRAFLFADARGYTRFTQEHGDEAAARLAAQLATYAREVAAAHGGQVIELRGDEALAVFSSARQAVRAASSLVDRCAGGIAAGTSLSLDVGIGLDVGEPISLEGGYRGAALNLAARLCSLAGPGEVLASEGVALVARKLDGLAYADRGAVQLKGFADPVRVVQIVVDQAIDGVHELPGPAARALPIGGFLGALPAGPLVARDAELRKVLSTVDAVAGGSGRLVFLAGEPGVGKTRLAQEIMLWLRNRGFVVASGRCYAPQEAVPFYPFLEALGTLYTTAPASIRADVPRRWPHLLRLLPNVSLSSSTGAGEGREEQERLFWSVTAFAQAMAEGVPLALLLDDIQWCDNTSLALLQHLARHTRAYRVLLLGTYRDTEVGQSHGQSGLQQALRDLGREQLAERVLIRRLDEEGTAALLATALGEEEVSAEFSQLIYRETEGNPFFTQEVLRALVERGDVFRENGRWERRDAEEIEVPENIRSAVGERLSRLDEDAQTILSEASVLGQTFGFEQLQFLSGRDEDEVEEALEAAKAAGLLRVEGRDDYAFNHALTQQVLYAELSPRRRRRLHRAAGEALENLPAKSRELRAAELAWHFLEADDTERALTYSLLAGDQAEAVFAHAEAERHYRAALELVRSMPEAFPAAEVTCLEKLGSVLRVQSRHAEALAILEEAARLFRLAGEQEGEIRIAAQIGITYAEEGTTDEGIARVESFLESIGSPKPSSALAALYGALARLRYFSNRHSESLAAADHAAELARRAGDETIVAQAEVRRGAALYMLGRYDEALQAERRAIELAESHGDTESVCRALHTVSLVYLVQGYLEQARIHRRQMIQVAEQIDDPNQIAFATAYAGLTEIYAGNWSDAHDYLERADSVREQLGSTWYSTYSEAFRGYLAGLRGNWLEADRLRQGATSARAHREDLFIQSLWAEQEILEGHPELAIQRLREAPHTGGLSAPIGLYILAWAELELGGEIAEAEAHARRAIELASTSSHVMHEGDAQRVLGMTLAARDNWQEAEAALWRAEALARQAGFPYSEARACYEHGLMYVRKGELGEAQRRLTSALAIFRRLGARPYIELVEQALRE